MKATTFVLFQALAFGVLAVPVENGQSVNTPKFDYHKGMTREQEGRKMLQCSQIMTHVRY
jgi:hypothetical protein